MNGKQIRQLEDALRDALLCIEDEVNIYAPEHCDSVRFKEAQNRHVEAGTLYYYAKNIKACRLALAMLRNTNGI